MAENDININKNSGILLARNAPVALVVGAAGFLGSFLVEKLLFKKIQVVGIDNFKTGKRENLEEAVKNKNFHLVVDSAQESGFDLPRLDYLFITASEKWDISNILRIFKEKKCRLLFVSSIELYSQSSHELAWFRETEGRIAKAAADNHLNARILRLGPVYGPRMNFQTEDPTIRLIAAALNDSLQKDIPQEFSTRALYITDAVDLIVKSMLSGATAQKIFDGVRPEPVAVSEIKQVLMDPLWYENKNFTPSELPPWRTPNLEKTIKFLNWKPDAELVKSLKETLNYFKEKGESFSPVDYGIKEEKVTEAEKWPASNALARNASPIDASGSQSDARRHAFGKADGGQAGWKEEKKEQLENLKPDAPQKEKTLKKHSAVLKKIKGFFYICVFLTLVTYALIWPVVRAAAGLFIYQQNMEKAALALEKGDFEKSFAFIKQSQNGIGEARKVLDSFALLRRTDFLKTSFEGADDILEMGDSAAEIAQSAASGTQALYQGMKAVTGELLDPSKPYFDKAQLEFSSAQENIAKLELKLDFLAGKIEGSKERLSYYRNLVEKGRAVSILLPDIIGLDKNKSYLILFQNNAELRPAGGFIGSVGQIDFEAGKLKKIDINDVYAIDGQLNIHVEPPKEIKEDLGQKDWFLRDSNWEIDFPTSARQAQWFYNKETGKSVQGVIALDLSAASNLLGTIGALDLVDYKESITEANLFEKAVSHAESGFFPGSQAKKTFLTAMVMELFNKLFFLPQQNWPGIVSSIGKSLEEKHISIYLNDSKLFSYLFSQNWTNALPRPGEEQDGYYFDLFAASEANLGANKANFYLDRSYNLDTVIGKEGEVKHRLKISYLNSSPQDTFPAGAYKNRMRLYLPLGSRINRVLWGESDITKDVTSYTDYGRSAFSFLTILEPKERKSLIVDYSEEGKISFKDQKAVYRLDIVKQAGTLKDPFVWHISFPINYKIENKTGESITPQEQTITTDLSVDRSFEVVFRR